MQNFGEYKAISVGFEDITKFLRIIYTAKLSLGICKTLLSHLFYKGTIQKLRPSWRSHIP
jgi:hypothetical protein